MALNNCPHPAIQLDEVVQKILEYAASGEHWKKSSNLRIVCKQWREMSFKGLCLSTSLPTVRLLNDKIWSDTDSFETYYLKRFSKTCPAHINLSNPRIPIGVKIDQLPLPRDLYFLREFSCYIAFVVVIKLRVFEEEGDNRITENPAFDFKFPNLTRVYVDLGLDEGKYEPWEQLVNHTLDASNRVGVVEYDYSCGYQDMYDPNTWPIAHSKVTHVEWCGPPTDLRRVIFPVVKKLVEIRLTLEFFNKLPDPNAESVALAEILERHSFTLQKVDITNDTSVRFVKCLKLPRGQLRELHTLETDVPILLSNHQSNPTSLPKLKTLMYAVGYHSDEESDGFKVSHLASSSLESLTWRWKRSLAATSITAEAEIREKMFVHKFKEEHFPVYPELLELKILNVPFCFGQAVISKVFHCMENLTCLTVHFGEKQLTKSMSKDYTDNIFNIFTGMTLNEIPKDEAVWSNSLKYKTHAITNLKNLTSLEIRTRSGSKCVLGKFIFHAAFHQMKKLELLRVRGSIKVEEELKEKWKAAGRRIVMRSFLHPAHRYSISGSD